MRQYWEQIGYTPCTTFWEDFSIADRFFGIGNAIEDTYKSALAYAKTDYKVFTELVLVLNHKIWQWYGVNNAIGIIYDTLWKMAENTFYEVFKDNQEALDYYFEVTN